MHGGALVLVLSRKLNETVVIGDNIRITVVGFDRNYVRLGSEAPREIKICREEIKNKDPRKDGEN